MNATTLKTLGATVALLVSAFAGYRYAAALYTAESYYRKKFGLER